MRFTILQKGNDLATIQTMDTVVATRDYREPAGVVKKYFTKEETNAVYEDAIRVSIERGWTTLADKPLNDPTFG